MAVTRGIFFSFVMKGHC